MYKFIGQLDLLIHFHIMTLMQYTTDFAKSKLFDTVRTHYIIFLQNERSRRQYNWHL